MRDWGRGDVISEKPIDGKLAMFRTIGYNIVPFSKFSFLFALF